MDWKCDKLALWQYDAVSKGSWRLNFLTIFKCIFIWLFLTCNFQPITIWATSWENLFMPYANNKGADQPALPCSLTIIIFGVGSLNCIIPMLAESSWASHFESYRVAKPQRQVLSWSGSKYLIWIGNCIPHSLSLSNKCPLTFLWGKNDNVIEVGFRPSKYSQIWPKDQLC